MRSSTLPIRSPISALVLMLACAEAPDGAVLPTEATIAEKPAAARLIDGGPYMFSPAVFDIDAAPDGSILVADGATIKRIGRRGVETVNTVPVIDGSTVNGLASNGRGSFFAASMGLDLAAGAGVWHVTPGRAALVADIEAFETENDPDALEGPQWKDPLCEAAGGFSAGPQSNPYHLTRASGGTVLVADAAGNTLLSTSQNGGVDWVAVFTPPTDANGFMVLFPLNADTDCYVQPVPTSVAVDEEGARYVGELIGITPANFGGMPSPGLSRVWRIEAGVENVTCPSADCTVAFDGLTSVIDVAFGPDGYLYVLEYDENGWFIATEAGNPAGGTLNRCDVDTGSCTVVADGLSFPGAITFDKWDRAWLLESNIIAPTVRQLDVS